MNRQNNETRRTALRRSAGRAAGAVLLAACMLALGCAKEFEEVLPGGAGGGKRIEVSFETPQMDEVRIDTRASQEALVNDVWVIQLNEAGTALLRPSMYISRLINNRVTLNLEDQRSTIIFIANTGDGTLFSNAKTAAEVEAVTKSYTTPEEFVQVQGYMSGRFIGMPDELKAMPVQLVRPYAMIDFHVAYNGPNTETFTLREIRICNVPKAMHYYRDPDALDPGTTASATYPATTSGFNGVWDRRMLVGGDAYDLTWLVPENGRGKGTATRQQDKTAAKALGGASGQGNYATYVEITGVYINAEGTRFDNTKYRIYLGGDAVSDYTLKRNTHYTVWCNIKGIDRLDARVTVGTPTYPGDYYDYTDNRTGRFLIAKSDVTNGTAVSWTTGQKLCKDGWRLPTVQEFGMMVYLSGSWYSANYGLSNQYYHTSTFGSATSDQRWAFNHSRFSISGGPTSDQAHVRCVKDLPSGGKKYPYVTTDNQGKRTVIVFREGSNGVKSGVIRANISSTQEGSSLTDGNWRLPSKLQVAIDSRGYDYWIWDNATGLCHNYRGGGYSNWRLPNPREAMVIAMMYNEIESIKYETIYTSVRVVTQSGALTSYQEVYYAKVWNGQTMWGGNNMAKFIKGSGHNWSCTNCKKTKAQVLCVRDA